MYLEDVRGGERVVDSFEYGVLLPPQRVDRTRHGEEDLDVPGVEWVGGEWCGVLGCVVEC